MTMRSSRLARFACAGLALSLAFLTTPAIAALASAFGPEVAIAEPQDGFVGRLDVSLEIGLAGKPLTVIADQMPPNEEFQLIWRTVKGNW